MSFGPSIEKTLAHEYCEFIEEIRGKGGDTKAIMDMEDTLRAFYEAGDKKLLDAYLNEIERCHPTLYEKIPFVQEIILNIDEAFINS